MTDAGLPADIAVGIVVEAEARVEQRVRGRVVEHIADMLFNELREGGPPSLPTNEQQAIAMIKTVAAELGAAAHALHEAAHALKERGVPMAANAAKQAAMRAKQAQVGLVGTGV